MDTSQSEMHAGAHQPAPPSDPGEPPADTFNPWSVVNLVFDHLCEQGLRPSLGDGGDPAAPAAALLEALSIQPNPEGNQEVLRAVRVHLDEIRAAVFEDAGPDRDDEPGPARVSE